MSRLRLVPLLLASVCLLFVAVMSGAQDPPGGEGATPGPGPCTQERLAGRSCAEPYPCTNACAHWCENLLECYQCCLNFAAWPDAYAECKGYCDDMPWPN